MKAEAPNKIIKERNDYILIKQESKNRSIKCDSDSIAGSVSQRACVYCGARVVLNPITDAWHIVHGPIGCASYTWDIRGSLSSGPEIYRNSFSTDLGEEEVIFGGEKKLERSIDEIIKANRDNPPPVIFVYATCIIGVIGDDIEAVCKKVQTKHNIKVVPVKSPGFAGNKSAGYKAACNALLELMDKNTSNMGSNSLNILGDFNLAGEMWIIKKYLSLFNINVCSQFTGDSRCRDIKKAASARLNIVQCAGSMTYLAKKMRALYGIPFINVSFFGVEDTKESLLKIADVMCGEDTVKKVYFYLRKMEKEANERLKKYKCRLAGKKAAIYVGGGFKAISLVKQFKSLGIKTVVVGTQTGKKEEYESMGDLTDAGTVILDDSNPFELEKFIVKTGAHILVGGVKERPLAYKLGIAFCDHNHERKHPLAGFEGAVNFAKEIDSSINSPVWNLLGAGQQ